MEIAEIEQIIKVCYNDVASRTDKEETFDIVESIVNLSLYSKRFDKVQWLRKEKDDENALSMYLDMLPDTLEFALAGFAIKLFSYANKYNLNLQGLRLGENDNRNRSLEDMKYSMMKIEMSHYRRYKKIIILIGMLCSYCNDNHINLLWFVNKRLEFTKSLVLNKI